MASRDTRKQEDHVKMSLSCFCLLLSTAKWRVFFVGAEGKELSFFATNHPV